MIKYKNFMVYEASRVPCAVSFLDGSWCHGFHGLLLFMCFMSVWFLSHWAMYTWALTGEWLKRTLLPANRLLWEQQKVCFERGVSDSSGVTYASTFAQIILPHTRSINIYCICAVDICCIMHSWFDLCGLSTFSLFGFDALNFKL